MTFLVTDHIERTRPSTTFNIGQAAFRSLPSSLDQSARKFISEVVEQRGKCHNPATQSGGVLLATVREVGTESSLGLKPGDAVVPLASLQMGMVHGM